MSDGVPTSDDFGLAGKVAIVTGAGAEGDGIGNGRAAAILLARALERACSSSTAVAILPNGPWR
jgi:NAD(P)-dependent dehydrogenase (short-subunit alcohol dehydrogenase family)